MKCQNCGGNVIMHDEGYSTIFRCQNCGKVGNEEEFEDDIQ